MLEEGLGDRSRHPGLLRQRALGPDDQGGRPPHRRTLGPALHRTVAPCPHADVGRNPARTGEGDSTRVPGLTRTGESLHALRVRYVAGPGAVSYTHLRAHETVLDLVCRL